MIGETNKATKLGKNLSLIDLLKVYPKLQAQIDIYLHSFYLLKSWIHLASIQSVSKIGDLT